jgi:hypothetical protein
MQVLEVWKCVRARLREISDVAAEKGESIAQSRFQNKDAKRKDNKEWKKEYNRRYNLLHKDKISYSNGLYRSGNLDTILQHRFQNKDKKKEYDREYNLRYRNVEYHRQYYLRNRDSKKDATREYEMRHKDKIRDSKRRYRIRNHPNPETYHPRDIQSKSWKSPDLVREFFNSIANQLHISNYNDWYRVSMSQIQSLEGVFTCL